MTDIVESLLPCPFCGAAARTDLLPHSGGPGWVQCSECECDQYMCDTIEEAVAKWNRRAPAQSVTHPSLVKALNDLHVWLEIEGCSDQVEIIDDAFSAAGITEYRCANCDGAGEWDEGPLPATSSTQISPDYRHMVCSDCEGKGTISLSSAERGQS